MSTLLQPKRTSPATKKEDVSPRIHLNTWIEAEEYFKEHLTPIGHSPKGRPIYAHDDIQALNVILPEDFWS